jgi:hypothetical protein
MVSSSRDTAIRGRRESYRGYIMRVAHTGRAAALLTTTALIALTGAAAATAAPPPDASVKLDHRADAAGAAVPSHFVGISVEWSLIEKYMNPQARPAFAKLLSNLGSGVLRIGGSSQDLVPFDAGVANSTSVITLEDLEWIRDTLAAVNAPGETPRWGVILGTALAPDSHRRPYNSPAHARAFVDGVHDVFTDRARKWVVSVALGNEPDLSYRGVLPDYLADLDKYLGADVTRPFAVDLPATSENILPWTTLANPLAAGRRWFGDWETILDAIAPATKAIPASLGTATSDHFYPGARVCTADAYRCLTPEILLSEERNANLAYEVYTHAAQAAQRGLAYRVAELGTAAGRGLHGVSDVAASATWALDSMFTVACPQPPDQPGANTNCATGGIGVNFHNAEVRAFFAPDEGNAYYNSILYDATPESGAPSAAPMYYAMLLFGRFAQGARDLHPVELDQVQPAAARVSAWQVEDEHRFDTLFLVNKSNSTVTLNVAVPDRSSRVDVDRMAPFDPTGAGRTLNAPQVRIDGHVVAEDGTWPGFEPQTIEPQSGAAEVVLGAGEAAVLSPR